MALEILQEKRWPALTIQLAVITVATGLLVSGTVNAFIGFSVAVVLCTFALQTTSVRFLWLYPVRTKTEFKSGVTVVVASRSTVKWDTHFLQAYLTTASLALAFGVYEWMLDERLQDTELGDSTYFGMLNGALRSLDGVLLGAMGFLLGILGVLVPLAFLVWWNRQINTEIEHEDVAWNDELEKETRTQPDE